jgi:hypothetical protein
LRDPEEAAGSQQLLPSGNLEVASKCQLELSGLKMPHRLEEEAGEQQAVLLRPRTVLLQWPTARRQPLEVSRRPLLLGEHWRVPEEVLMKSHWMPRRSREAVGVLVAVRQPPVPSPPEWPPPKCESRSALCRRDRSRSSESSECVRPGQAGVFGRAFDAQLRLVMKGMARIITLTCSHERNDEGKKKKDD